MCQTEMWVWAVNTLQKSYGMPLEAKMHKYDVINSIDHSAVFVCTEDIEETASWSETLLIMEQKLNSLKTESMILEIFEIWNIWTAKQTE